MANPLNNEQEIYSRIDKERITVPPLVWDIVYRYLGDELTAISQITLSYCIANEPIAVEDAKKIIEHAKNINIMVRQILIPENIKDDTSDLQELKKINSKLHPVINELFFHYVGNDLYGITMIVGSYLGPDVDEPVPVDSAKKVLNKVLSMKQFLDKLREATHQDIRQ
ncbi:MAG: hypothetical protein HQL27_04450 [Candidatus Omnitrophica bacterium]|nr:hypothetical protein [Candidatus Omnitrophota bacterium]